MKTKVHLRLKILSFLLALLLGSFLVSAQTIILTSDQQLTDLTNADKKNQYVQ